MSRSSWLRSTGRSRARSRCTSGASGASSTGRDRCAAGARGRLQRPRHLARRPRARARDPEPAGHEAGIRRQRPASPRGRVPAATGSSIRTTSAVASPTGCARCCSRLPASSTRTTSRSATSSARQATLAQLTERFGELCADAAGHTDAKIVYEFMPSDVNVHSTSTQRSRSSSARARRTAASRSTPGTCPSWGSRRTSCGASRSSTSPGSSSPTVRSRTWTTPSTR